MMRSDVKSNGPRRSSLSNWDMGAGTFERHSELIISSFSQSTVSRDSLCPFSGDCGNLIPIADEYELTVVGWSVDMDVKSKEDRGTLESRLSDAEEVTPSQICLMHDSSHMLKTRSLDALPEVIQLVHDKGYKFVTLEECLKG